MWARFFTPSLLVKMLRRSFAMTLALVLVSALALSCTSRAAAPEVPSPNRSEVRSEPLADPSATQKIQLEKLQADIQKAQVEVAKTKAELENLQEIGPGLNRLVTIATSFGGVAGAIFGAVIALLVAWLGQRFNRNYNKAQSDKLRQDRDFEHEKHNLELYKSLGSDNSRGQFAAAAVLLQRLGHISRIISTADDNDTRDDKITIIHVLTSVLKEQIDEPNSTVLRKHIADNMVKALNLVEWGGHPKSDTLPSILAEFDVQKCKLRDVFWRGVNLRKVDLYGSDLSGASLRNADLRDAILYQSTLVGSKFIGANLEGANLEGACIAGADFSGANLKEVKLLDAEFDLQTKCLKSKSEWLYCIVDTLCKGQANLLTRSCTEAM